MNNFFKKNTKINKTNYFYTKHSTKIFAASFMKLQYSPNEIWPKQIITQNNTKNWRKLKIYSKKMIFIQNIQQKYLLHHFLRSLYSPNEIWSKKIITQNNTKTNEQNFKKYSNK